MARIPGPFQTDDAIELLDDLEGMDAGDRQGRVVAVLQGLLANTGYVEAPQMAEAVAAAALVAGSVDPDVVAGERAVPSWLEDEPVEVDDTVEELATRTFHRALRHDDNEWWDLWESRGTADQLEERLLHYLSAFE